MSKWIEEELEPGLRVSYGLKSLLHSGQSKFQTVDVVDLEPFGRTLLIDGLIQSCQIDEYVYHESLVHPALLSHPCPKRVYIGGGGEGSTAREVLRHRTVEKCVMVDIDADVVHFCREHLPENTAAFADKRLDLVIDDAKAVLQQATEGFDVIIMDLDDPLEGGPCYQLYTVEFYQMCLSKLNPGGVFVTQSGQAGITRHHLVWSPVNSTLRQVFPKVHAYNQAVYSFMDEWGERRHTASSDAPTPHRRGCVPSAAARSQRRRAGGAQAALRRRADPSPPPTPSLSLESSRRSPTAPPPGAARPPRVEPRLFG
jgi:thermospermine synthase